MDGDSTKPLKEGAKSQGEIEEAAAAAPPPHTEGGSSGGWGGWGFSPFSYLSDLQKAAAATAEEISRNAVEAAKTAAMKIVGDEDSEASKEYEAEASKIEEESEDDNDKRRKAALDKIEKASEESVLGQGLKVFDNSVEHIASEAWQALGNAWKGGSDFVHRLENSAANLAGSIQKDGLPGTNGSTAPSLLETGKAFTAKGMQVLEMVGRETMDLLISETGFEVDKDTNEAGDLIDQDQLFEEVTFDRCFYIYGGPEQLEELEALSNHHALLFNRRKVKLSSEQKSFYDGKLKQVQHLFILSSEVDGISEESEKGKQVETGSKSNIDEIKTLHDSSVRKAAEMAAGFTHALAGLGPNDIIQRTAGRLDSLHSEGVHRLSEMSCLAVSQLLMHGKSIIYHTNTVQDEDVDENIVHIDWPEDSVEKARLIRAKVQSMTRNVEAVYNSFITGMSDVAEAYVAAMKGPNADAQGVTLRVSIQEKAIGLTENLCNDRTTAMGKLQDGLRYMSYVVVSTSMPAG